MMERPAPSVGELFGAFFVLGVTGFGGVLPMTQRLVVERQQWLTANEFSDLLALCQFLPGGNVLNLSVAIGSQFRGVPGAAASIRGLLAAPSAIVIALGAIYGQFQDEPHVRHLFAGLSAAAAGLLLATAVKLARPLQARKIGVAVAALCFLAVAVLRLPMLPTMVVLASVSIFATWKSGA
jgi:chromate transporter